MLGHAWAPAAMAEDEAIVDEATVDEAIVSAEPHRGRVRPTFTRRRDRVSDAQVSPKASTVELAARTGDTELMSQVLADLVARVESLERAEQRRSSRTTKRKERTLSVTPSDDLGAMVRAVLNGDQGPSGPPRFTGTSPKGEEE